MSSIWSFSEGTYTVSCNCLTNNSMFWLKIGWKCGLFFFFSFQIFNLFLLMYSFSDSRCSIYYILLWLVQVQIASAAALVVMLDRTTSISLQIAEYRDPAKCGSFMPLSISLGQILMQLHTGTWFYFVYIIVFSFKLRKKSLSIKRLKSRGVPGATWIFPVGLHIGKRVIAEVFTLFCP